MVGETLATMLGFLSSTTALDQLPQQYQLHYGSKEAPVEIVEYIELECPSCKDFLLYEFEKVEKDLMETGKVHYAVNITPRTLLSVQLLVCVEALGEEKGRELFELVARSYEVGKEREIRARMREFVSACGIDSSFITDSFDALESHPKVAALQDYVINGELPTAVPTFQIDGELISEIPTAQSLYNRVGTLEYQRTHKRSL